MQPSSGFPLYSISWLLGVSCPQKTRIHSSTWSTEVLCPWRARRSQCKSGFYPGKTQAQRYGPSEHCFFLRRILVGSSSMSTGNAKSSCLQKGTLSKMVYHCSIDERVRMSSALEDAVRSPAWVLWWNRKAWVEDKWDLLPHSSAQTQSKCCILLLLPLRSQSTWRPCCLAVLSVRKLIILLRTAETPVECLRDSRWPGLFWVSPEEMPDFHFSESKQFLREDIGSWALRFHSSHNPHEDCTMQAMPGLFIRGQIKHPSSVCSLCDACTPQRMWDSLNTYLSLCLYIP